MRLNAGDLGSSEELYFLLLRKGLDVLRCFFFFFFGCVMWHVGS